MRQSWPMVFRPVAAEDGREVGSRSSDTDGLESWATSAYRQELGPDRENSPELVTLANWAGNPRSTSGLPCTQQFTFRVHADSDTIHYIRPNEPRCLPTPSRATRALTRRRQTMSTSHGIAPTSSAISENETRPILGSRSRTTSTRGTVSSG